jgi:hypothetical protein
MTARRPVAPHLRRALPGVAWLLMLAAAACDDAVSTVPAAVGPPRAIRPTLGSAAEDVAYAVSTRSGYVYIGGETYGSLDGANLGNSDAFVRKYDPEGDIIWARQFGTPLADRATGVAADGTGNVYVVGMTAGSLAGSRGSRDGMLRKYGASGNVLWTRQFGTSGDEYLPAVVVDGVGNIIVVGRTFGAMSGSNLGQGDALVRKYAPNGSVVWTRQFGSTSDEIALAVAVDSLDNVFVAGYTFGAMAGSNKGLRDAFVRKFTSSGTAVWTRQFGTSAGDEATGVAVDGGSVIVVGYTGGVLYGTNYGLEDAYFRRYTGDGVLVRTKQFGTAGVDWANGVSVGPGNSFFIAGRTSGDLAGSLGNHDGWIRKYSSADVQLFTRQFGTPDADNVLAVAAGQGSEIYVAGSTAGVMAESNQGGVDAYLRRLDSSGYAEWTDQ